LLANSEACREILVSLARLKYLKLILEVTVIQGGTLRSQIYTRHLIALRAPPTYHLLLCQ